MLEQGIRIFWNIKFDIIELQHLAIFLNLTNSFEGICLIGKW